MLIKYQTFFNYVSNHTGMEIKHLSDIESIYNSLNIQVIYCIINTVVIFLLIIIITHYTTSVSK